MPFAKFLILALVVAVLAACRAAQPQHGAERPEQAAPPPAVEAEDDAYTGCTACALRHRSFQESRERRREREAQE